MAVERETYLGDGLYGTFDGFAVRAAIIPCALSRKCWNSSWP